VRTCLADAFAPFKSAYTPAAFADTVPDFENLQRRLQTMVVFVAELSGRIVGTVGISTSHTSEAHLRGMAVVPSAQGKGIGQQLLSAAIDHCRLAGCTRVTLDTTAPLRAALLREKRVPGDRPDRRLLWNEAVRVRLFHSMTAKHESESVIESHAFCT
jgi:GNAT superfamily N-acetyltransferase